MYLSKCSKCLPIREELSSGSTFYLIMHHGFHAEASPIKIEVPQFRESTILHWNITKRFAYLQFANPRTGSHKIILIASLISPLSGAANPYFAHHWTKCISRRAPFFQYNVYLNGKKIRWILIPGNTILHFVFPTSRFIVCNDIFVVVVLHRQLLAKPWHDSEPQREGFLK
jgi:hypothetical protein